MTTPQLTALPHLAILDITGDDAQAFLHAQVPSDIRTLNNERAQISGWCTAKGRLLTPEEFGNIVIRASGPGGVLRLKDVARLELGAFSYDQQVTLDGQPVGHGESTCRKRKPLRSSARRSLRTVSSACASEIDAA